MPLSPPVARERLHLRRVSYEGFRREDGLYDIEAHIVDTKDHDFKLSMGMRSKSQPVHEMWARVTINDRFDVVDIEAATDEMPYPGYCDQITPQYKQLVGANLMQGFRKAIAEKLGRVKGCTHISELLGYLPTAAVQTFAGERYKQKSAPEGQKPFQLDACHALDTTGEAVRLYYPKWFVGEAVLAES